MTTFNPLLHRGIFAKTANIGSSEQLWWADLFAAIYKSNGTHDIEISNSEPIDTTKLWLDPNDTNVAPGQLKIYNNGAWVNITPSLYASHIALKGGMAWKTVEW